MATYRTVINSVLRALREDELDGSETELTDDYHKLVGLFVNQIKEEIEDAHTWRDLQVTCTASILASTQSAVITGATDRSRVVHMHSEQGSIPLVFDVTVPTNPIPLAECPLAELEYRIAMDIPGTATEPCMFAVVAGTDEAMVVKVYPKPVGARSLTLQMVTPQDRLEIDDLDVVIKIPFRPIEMGAIWYALEERGEELGVNALFTEERFRKALADAITRDAEEQGGYELQLV